MPFADTITIDALETDPFPVYARLRREAPIAAVPAANCWFATRWDDIQTLSRHEDFTSASDDAPVNDAFGRPNILTTEGPTHRALRDGIEPGYRTRPVAQMTEPLVRPLAERQLEHFLSSGQTDLMAGYFEPVSSLALARSLGIMDVDGPTLRGWFHGLCQGAINFERDPARQAICDATVAQIESHVRPLLARLRTAPDSSPLSHMLHAGMESGHSRPDDWILPTLKVTLLGGMQEPGHAAGSTLAGLLSDPAQIGAVREDPGLIPQAIDEGLRWVAPIGTFMRTARVDTEVSGIPIPQGTPVSLILASANRDEAKFTDPDRFDLHRSDAAHVSFGLGAHFCVGRWFAKAQVEILLRVLLEALPRLALAAPPVFGGWEFRAPRALEVCW